MAVARLELVGLLGVGLALAAACGHTSREAETSQAGKNGEGDACADGKRSYQEQQATILAELAAQACTADSDCGLLTATNACTANCGSPAPVSKIEAAAERLRSLASEACASCAPIPIPPCDPPGPLSCKAGKCVEVP